MKGGNMNFSRETWSWNVVSSEIILKNKWTNRGETLTTEDSPPRHTLGRKVEVDRIKDRDSCAQDVKTT